MPKSAKQSFLDKLRKDKADLEDEQIVEAFVEAIIKKNLREEDYCLPLREGSGSQKPAKHTVSGWKLGFGRCYVEIILGGRQYYFYEAKDKTSVQIRIRNVLYVDPVFNKTISLIDPESEQIIDRVLKEVINGKFD